jgi:hypothetical protein
LPSMTIFEGVTLNEDLMNEARLVWWNITGLCDIHANCHALCMY